MHFIFEPNNKTLPPHRILPHSTQLSHCSALLSLPNNCVKFITHTSRSTHIARHTEPNNIPSAGAAYQNKHVISLSNQV